jgi:uncharacterized membrane protein YraQ (UPF0718 family)
MRLIEALGHALALAGSMGWSILWALILGFSLSAVVQTVVRRDTIRQLLGDERARTLVTASGLGAASSSCSYAAVAMARSLFRKGAHFTAAMAFEIASTNLVLELGIILWLLIGWQFTLAEFVAAPVMIALVALAFRWFLSREAVAAAREQADRGRAGAMEGHAAMDMSVQGEGTFWARLTSSDGFSAVANGFVMEWGAVIRDIALGLLVAGAVAAWVPHSFWQSLFLTEDPTLAKLWGPILGPLVAVVSFVCSVGNVPLAGVLWNGGISFGGVASFLLGDLIIVPIILIYRKYYGNRMALQLTVTFYAAMVVAGYVVEIVFGILGIVPTERDANVSEASISWNYTTVLNAVFLALAAVLVVRSMRTGGLTMVRHMSDVPEAD